MISKNVMKTDEFDDSIYYRAACSCGSNKHDVTIEFEIDKGVPSMLFLNFYKNIAWCPSWSNLNLFQRIGSRIACSLKMLFTGYIELEESFIIQGEDDINAFIEALEEGKKYLKNEKCEIMKIYTPNPEVKGDKTSFDKLDKAIKKAIKRNPKLRSEYEKEKNKLKNLSKK